MNDRWSPPPGHWIDEQMARALVVGDYGAACRMRVMACCRPIYWWARDVPGRDIIANGTVTILQTPKKLLAVTAAHVIENFKVDRNSRALGLQIGNAVVEDLDSRLIAVDEGFDLATIEIDPAFLVRMGGHEISPLNSWPPIPPQEGSGILVGGFPGLERRILSNNDVNFGLFVGMGVAAAVSHDQIAWKIEREYGLETPGIPEMPPEFDLGGISGGPIITQVESRAGILTHRLGGIISQAHAQFEYMVAKRADFILEDGSIRGSA